MVFPTKDIWGSRAPLRMFFMGSYLGEDLNCGYVDEEGMSMVNRCSLCKDNEESIDHILIYCEKIRGLWTFS